MSISLPARFAAALKSLANALLPQSCVLCGDPANDTLCPGCCGDLPVLAAPRCPICALPTPLGNICGGCLAEPPHFDATLACFAYDYPLDRLLQSLKYAGGLQLAAFFGRALAGLAAPGGDLMLPVPLHRSRLAERGYNQALEIARGPARKWAVPLDPWCIERRVQGRNQADLPWRERSKNVRKAFGVRAKSSLDGQHVLLVDDVMTTGATLNELARLLKRNGASKVTNCVVARTLADD